MIAWARLGPEVLDLAAHVRAVESPTYGAVATFLGAVHNHDPSVEGTVTHRRGLLTVGDVALAVTVATAHRAQAFDLCHGIVEHIKHSVPVWKRECLADGSHHWVGVQP